METRKVTMPITTAGGNASKGTRTYRVTIPNLWAQDWDIIKEDRDIMIIKDGERIIIERVRKMEVYKIDKDELLDAVREYGGSFKIGFNQGEAHFYSLEDNPEEACEQVQVIDDQELSEMGDKEVITFLQDNFDIIPSKSGYQVKIK